MKVVLLENFKNLGLRGDIIDVKSGFAKNFLIPFKKASFYSGSSLPSSQLHGIDSGLGVDFLRGASVKISNLTIFFRRKKKKRFYYIWFYKKEGYFV